jgi:hypothetical protein
MPIDTSVKFFHNGMAGLNRLLFRNGAGAETTVRQRFFDVMNAVFVAGFNTVSVQSLTVTNNVATVTFANSTHGFEVDTVIQVTGATPSGLNGEQRVTSVAGPVITFTTEGISNGSASGTITAKYAPLGWAYVGTPPTTAPMNLRGGDPLQTSIGVIMQPVTIAQTGGPHYGGFTFAGYNSYDNTTLLSLFGTRHVNGWNGFLSENTDDPWILVGDKSSFYVLYNHNASANAVNTNGVLVGFGLFKSVSPTDAFNRYAIGTSDPATGLDGNNSAANLARNSVSLISSEMVLSAGVNGQTVGANNTTLAMELPTASAGMAGSNIAFHVYGSAYPNANDSSLILCRKMIGDTGGLRGYLRGLYQSPQNCASAFNQMDRVTGQGAFAGKRLLAIRAQSIATGTGSGVTFFDITGPWE